MELIMRHLTVLMMCLAVAAPAAAQTTYVSGSLIGEFSRFGGVDIDEDDLRRVTGIEPLSRDGETIGFDVRIGRGLGERWGVELAFARGGRSERRETQAFASIVGSVTPIITPTLPGGSPTIPTVVFPDFELLTERQHTTIDVGTWLRQELGERVDLAFLGGISFSRLDAEEQFLITDPRLAVFSPFSSEIETVHYGVGPVVGAETIVELSDRLALTAGARLHGVGGGWLIRPSVGVRWQF